MESYVQHDWCICLLLKLLQFLLMLFSGKIQTYAWVYVYLQLGIASRPMAMSRMCYNCSQLSNFWPKLLFLGFNSAFRATPSCRKFILPFHKACCARNFQKEALRYVDGNTYSYRQLLSYPRQQPLSRVQYLFLYIYINEPHAQPSGPSKRARALPAYPRRSEWNSTRHCTAFWRLKTPCYYSLKSDNFFKAQVEPKLPLG